MSQAQIEHFRDELATQLERLHSAVDPLTDAYSGRIMAIIPPSADAEHVRGLCKELRRLVNRVFRLKGQYPELAK
jgi:hypothetical protein